MDGTTIVPIVVLGAAVVVTGANVVEVTAGRLCGTGVVSTGQIVVYVTTVVVVSGLVVYGHTVTVGAQDEMVIVCVE